ncbi:MAG TPA: von Willebrand factor type A domain-containing protein [Kofleriaceae bacterium]|nr:von Willebrand factor type A domain-containing protein [Kofleriaceae bacterium]
MTRLTALLRPLATTTTLAAFLLSACGGYARPGHLSKSMSMAPPPTYAMADGSDEMTPGTEEYEHRADNPLMDVAMAPLSTFSIDVDTASMANVRRFLRENELPPADAVRVEEMINYYRYDYAEPTGDLPLGVTTEVAPSPFHAGRLIARIGVKGKSLGTEALPPRNLVFLVDTSGSMSAPNKLPLVQDALSALADQLGPRDTVSMVAYAGSAGIMLDPTSGEERGAIKNALYGLSAGGGTNGEGGIKLAYQLAAAHFDARGINRVILCTDGDFNVGVSDQGSLVRLVEEKRKSGVYLTVLGFGMGNVKDSTMEKLAQHGNGNYGYIDSIDEAKKTLVDEAAGTLVTLAHDVKIQVELDPASVAQYRLIGYENRLMRDQDFRDDTKDAGELGVGQTVTALYELVPAKAAASGDLFTVRVRFKRPGNEKGEELAVAARPQHARLADASNDFRFATAIAGFGMMLRKSEHKGDLTWKRTLDLAGSAAGTNPRRQELVALVTKAAQLAGGDGAAAAIAE